MNVLELDQDPAAVGVYESLNRFVTLAVTVTHVLLVASVWGRWRDIILLTGVFVLLVGFNVLVAKQFFSERARTVDAARLIINLLANFVFGHFSDWQLPVWLYLPLNVLWIDTHLARWFRYVVFGLILLTGIVAVLEGCSPLVPLVFIVISALVYGISNARVALLKIVLERLAQRHQELARAHEELAQAHQRGREQDRLSSLGMLAAGIAHEINNPLSYVKSNVNALYRDLRAQKELPEVLGEYVTEVLPATLDGIQRIATIVSDLRRFARGDPEPMVEYDLNEEIQAALRITHGRIEARCKVELELGPLPRMMGKPQQMAQVVINLLINAAQAMKEHGKIAISTRQEGEEVVMVVRDTGQGMSPEVLDKLFQPFFSTKPLGEGTGMGLAVVHGIVTAHGGRIQVESQPDQGTTFTLRLPRVLPVRPVAQASQTGDAPA
ncbi:sensor histidine kinase [Hyalangium sp.]|uniref:sensor histidine kinase n=1 Tax=Hyalangium sp. TaxID=2028555 RepID=UPI002D2E8DF3|nr:ATP-binding protein [Hyalangium sp.]HYI00347.1 ATP-binding protein [Hyalangium sp.]